jgi:hypothetical protein
MTDTTVADEKPPPTDPRPPCGICESTDHTTQGHHENGSDPGTTGHHENGAGV